jgi:predicted  nucleic acid-binding Zn-ribbon protein
MNISNDTPAMNYVDYFTNKLPLDLANMASLRDELVIRQGALSAVQDTLDLKAAAAKALVDAQAQADAMLADAKKTLSEAKSFKSTQDARTKALDLAEATFNDKANAFTKSSAAKEAALLTREAAATKREAELTKQGEDLQNNQKSLDDRVKAFQAKVAALSA